MHPATAKTAVQPPDAAQPEESPSATTAACQRLRPQPLISYRTGPPVLAGGMKSLKGTGLEKIESGSTASTETRKGMARAVAVQSG